MPRVESSKPADRPVMPAPTMTIISVGRKSALFDPAYFVDVAGERLHGLERRTRKHAVTEVEDVARAARRASQDLFARGKNPLPGAKQQRRIHISLNPPVVADDRPRFVDVLAPVDADDVR